VAELTAPEGVALAAGEQAGAAAEFHRGEGFTRRIAEVLPNILYVFDLRTRSNLYVNREVGPALGYPPEYVEAAGAEFVARHIHPEDQARFADNLGQVAALPDGQTRDFEYRMRTAAGEWRWFLSRDGVFERDAAGAALRIIGTATDITERKRAEVALQASEERLRLSMKAANQGLYDLDLRTGEAVVSPEYATMLGYDPSSFRETNARWLERLHPDDHGPVEAVYRAYVAGELPEYSVEFRQRTRAGTWKWIWSLGRIVERAPDGTPWRMMGTHTDIDDRKKEESERRRREEQMRHVQKLESLGVLAGGIAHDFNNLLVAMLGNADLALEAMPPAHPAREFVADIETAARRAAELCRQMLAYAGKGRFVLEKVDLSVLVQEMGQILGVSVGKNVSLHYALGAALPPVEVDGAQLRQVVMNLITNASEAVGEKPGVVTLTTNEMSCDREYLEALSPGASLREGRYVYLEVADTGSGMDEATLRRIFDPFFSTKFAGRGLGLAAVQGIVRGHRGAIKVYSVPGRGTTFQVLFPAADGFAEAASAGGEAAQEWTGRGTILLVDDEPQVRTVAGRMLRHLGFEVVEAADGVEALARFREIPAGIACVVLDLSMPRMGGEEAFRELRRIRGDVRVVLSSGYSEQEITQRFAGKGHAGFVQKPYSLGNLREALRRVLGANQR